MVHGAKRVTQNDTFLSVINNNNTSLSLFVSNFAGQHLKETCQNFVKLKRCAELQILQCEPTEFTVSREKES